MILRSLNEKKVMRFADAEERAFFAWWVNPGASSLACWLQGFFDFWWMIFFLFSKRPRNGGRSQKEIVWRDVVLLQPFQQSFRELKKKGLLFLATLGGNFSRGKKPDRSIRFCFKSIQKCSLWVAFWRSSA